MVSPGANLGSSSVSSTGAISADGSGASLPNKSGATGAVTASAAVSCSAKLTGSSASAAAAGEKADRSKSTESPGCKKFWSGVSEGGVSRVATRETNEVGELPSKIPESARSAINYKESQYSKVPNNISETHKKNLDHRNPKKRAYGPNFSKFSTLCKLNKIANPLRPTHCSNPLNTIF